MTASRVVRHPLAILAAALVILPYAMIAIGMTVSIASEIAIFAMVGLGYNLLLGYTGLVSFGHGAFFGLAAYAAALFQIHLLGNSLIVPILFGVAFAALLGLVIGFLVLRRRGVYFALLTLAFTAMFFYIVFRWTSFTGGENGLGGISRPPFAGLDLDDQMVFYGVVAVVVFAVAWLMWRVVNSPFGRVLTAIRENEQRATFAGYPVRRYKLIAFVISTTVVGLAGTLFAFLKYFVSADLVHVNFSGEILAMSIIGGMRDFIGPPIGALFFILFSPTGLVGVGARLISPFLKVRETLAAMASRAQPNPAAEVPAFLRAENPDGTRGSDGVALECRAATKRFGAFTAVANVDLQVFDRKVQALIGPNGAGKTTLFNVLSGMYPPDGGVISCRGEAVQGRSADALARRGIARSFQVTNLFLGLSVWENLRLAVQARDARRFNLMRHARDMGRVNEETAALATFLGLEGLEEALASDLSYGGQRLLEIGVALAAKPRVLLLDEPLAGLAAAERERVVGLIGRLAEHMGVLVVEHDIDRVFAFAETITVMDNGAVLTQGAPEAVRSHPEVQRVYLGSGKSLVAQRTKPAADVSAEPLLTVGGINTYYGSSHILHDVSLDVRAGEMVALLGRNGAGKSSTIKAITGLNPPRSGTVHFMGQPIARRSPEDIALRGIGLVPQGRRLFSNLTVAENLAMGRLRRRSNKGVRWTEERIFEFFPRIKERFHTKADVLSGGEQQMVAIARALSGNVRLLLLDEPFEGLSPAMAEEIFHSINELRQEVPILIIEHDLDLVLALADRVYVLDRGTITHEGPARLLLSDLELRKKTLWL